MISPLQNAHYPWRVTTNLVERYLPSAPPSATPLKNGGGAGCGTVCFAQLKYRPVNDWRAKIVGATHAFWYVQGSKGVQYILSGGPNMLGGVNFDNIWASSDTATAIDNASATTFWDSGLSCTNCGGVDAMIEAAQAFTNNSMRYDPLNGPNSNTDAHFLGTVGGFAPELGTPVVGGFVQGGPPGSIGWWASFPSLR